MSDLKLAGERSCAAGKRRGVVKIIGVGKKIGVLQIKKGIGSRNVAA
jgi:hypothetical protein